MKQSRALQRSGYNFESTGYDNCVSQAGFWVTVSWLLYDNGTWHWWPRFPVVSTFL